MRQKSKKEMRNAMYIIGGIVPFPIIHSWFSASFSQKPINNVNILQRDVQYALIGGTVPN